MTLEEQVAHLSARVDALESGARKPDAERVAAAAAELNLSHMPALMLGRLVTSRRVSRQEMMSALYPLLNTDSEEYTRKHKGLDTGIFRLRKLLSSYDVEIVSEYGYGWRLEGPGLDALKRVYGS